MAKQQSITSLPRSPQDDRRSRMIQYTVAMSIRVVCIVACLFTPGWWLLIPAAGAVFLPYVAVVLANAKGGGTSPTTVVRPGAVARRNDAGDRDRSDSADNTSTNNTSTNNTSASDTSTSTSTSTNGNSISNDSTIGNDSSIGKDKGEQ